MFKDFFVDLRKQFDLPEFLLRDPFCYCMRFYVLLLIDVPFDHKYPLFLPFLYFTSPAVIPATADILATADIPAVPCIFAVFSVSPLDVVPAVL
jgi:hypothetical protein